MTESLGRIERPLASEYQGGRKLYFVPLVFLPPEPPPELLALVDRYWNQVESHVANLERKLGEVKRVFHELVTVGGDEGAGIIERLSAGSHRIARARLERGAQLQPIEDEELLAESMDWGRCLSIGLQSQRVLTLALESYSEVVKSRNEHMARRIDEALQDTEAGLLVMREGHQVQFPSSIQVFYVAPPGLDEMKRWLRAQETEPGHSPDPHS